MALDLLKAGGSAVDAAIGANVARATLYRHFPSGNDLLAAAFNSLIPPAPMPPDLDAALGGRYGHVVNLFWIAGLALARGRVRADAEKRHGVPPV